MKKKNSNTASARIAWACRRGMLELDVLLGNFFHDRYEGLSPEEKTHFNEFLTRSDPEIYAWLLGQEPAPAHYLTLVETIQKHAKSRF